MNYDNIKTHTLQGYIELCKSHQNLSNYDTIEELIKHIQTIIDERDKK